MEIAQTTGKPKKDRKFLYWPPDKRSKMDLKNARSNAHKKKNPERVRQVHRDWVKRNRAKRKCYMDAYNTERKEAQRAYDATRYLRPENIAARNVKKESRAAYMKIFSKKNRYIWQAADSKRKAIKRKNLVGNQKLIIAWFKTWRALKKVPCFWCREMFKPEDCHGDHITPISKGGAHTIENICVSCGDCNRRKHNKPIAVWNQQIAEPVLF